MPDSPFDPVPGGPISKDDAQERADQIAAFRAEVQQLEKEGVSPFGQAQLAMISSHHEAVLERLAGEFDIDRTAAERRMSVGMRLASGFGAATLTAAVVSFLYQVWGAIPTPGQVVLLTAGPVTATIAMIVAGTIERTRYIAAVMAVVACGALVTQTVLLGEIFNLRSSPHPLLLWGAFAIAIAVPWRFVLPFALGVLSLVCYVAALTFWLFGFPWTMAIERPEPLMIAATVLMPFASRVPPELVPGVRSVLLMLVLAPVLVMSAFGQPSLLPWNWPTIRVAYQIVGALAALVVLATGVRRSQDDVILIGGVFAGVLLLTRFVDWWWDWMPRYLFFLILAAVALTWIWGLRVLRRRVAARPV